jgi:hypothetical protein
LKSINMCIKSKWIIWMLKAQNCFEKILNFFKGVVFYNVPHISGTQDLSKYFKWQCQQITKDTIWLGLLKNMKSFDRKMKQLSIDFNKFICKSMTFMHSLKDYLLIING